MIDLFEPRYIVHQSYFYCPYEIGQEVEKRSKSWHLTTTSYRDEFGETVNCANLFPETTLKEFPHLFKELKWFERRNIEDMPLYLKNNSGKIYEVKEHFTGENKDGFLPVKDGLGANGERYYEKYTPATEEEYLSQF